MSTVLLVRHGRTAANSQGTLAGWSPDIHLDEHGQAQVDALAARLQGLPLTAVVSSPLDRCLETASALIAGRDLTVSVDEAIGEVHYGEWTGEPLKSLAKQPLWKVVQQHPSAAVFPDGEGLAAMQARAVAAVRRWNVELGDDAVYCVVSHGDVIKSLVADALGLHLDLFQRIVVDPASVSVIRYGTTRPFVDRLNDTGGDLSGLAPPKKRRRRSASADDAVVGGGAGSSPRRPRKKRT